MKLEELLNLLKTEHKVDVASIEADLTNAKANNEALTKQVGELTAAKQQLEADKQAALADKQKAEETLCSLQKEVYFEKLVAEKKELPAQKEAVLSHFKDVKEMESFYANRTALLNDKPQGSSAGSDKTNKFDAATNRLIQKKGISEKDAEKYLKNEEK